MIRRFLSALLLPLCPILYAQDPADYVPDLSKSDIYQPYLNRTPLSGWWKIQKTSSDHKNTPDDKGMKEKFYAAEYNDSSWEKDIVPNNINAPFCSLKPTKEERAWGGVAWLRRNFTAPSLKEGERAILHFDEVIGFFKVFVNGKLAADKPFIYESYQGPNENHDIDITQFIMQGEENSIAIRLNHDGNPVMWGSGPVIGVTGLVYLDVKPAAWTDRVLVTPQSNLKDVDFDCIVAGSEKDADASRWTGEIFEWKSGATVATAKFEQPYVKDGIRYVSSHSSIQNPKLWSCESPFLYGIKIKNANGQIAGIQRFGMRTFVAKDGNFLLNGKPTMLRGVCIEHFVPRGAHGFVFALAANAGDFDKKYWQQYKNLNINHIRLHSRQEPPSGYDAFDELGFIITDELAYPSTRIVNPERADEIDIKGWDAACDNDGKLLPGFLTKIENRFRHLYSHPSVCTYSFGNEIRIYTGRVGVMLNNIYDLYEKVDRQHRPRTSSSGRAAPESIQYFDFLSKHEKGDYLDMHDYSGSLRQTPFFYAIPLFNQYLKAVKESYGPAGVPIVNGETVYYGEYTYKEYSGIWSSKDAAEPNWKPLLYVFNGDWRMKEEMAANLSFYWCRNWGTKGYIFDRPRTRALSIERIIENQRRSWPELDGFDALTEPIKFGPAYPFDKVEFEHIPEWHALKRSCAPTIAIFDWISQNRFAGEPIKTTLNVINNHEATVAGVRFEATIKDSSGKAISSKSLDVGSIPCGERKSFPVEFIAPDADGAYTLAYRLTSGGQVLSDRELELNVRGWGDVFEPLKTDKAIALYDASAVFGGMKPFSTEKMLKAFNVPHKSISSFDGLSDFDVLVIGSCSIDATVRAGSQEIRSFVEKGGRLLVF